MTKSHLLPMKAHRPCEKATITVFCLGGQISNGISLMAHGLHSKNVYMGNSEALFAGVLISVHGVVT